MSNRFCLACALMTTLLGGCQRVVDTTAFVIVNGRPLLAEQVKEAVLIEAKGLEIAGRPVATNFEFWANNRAMEMVAPMLSTMLIEGEIERRNLQPDTNDVGQALTYYNAVLGKNCKTADDMAKLFGALENPFRNQFETTAKLAAFARVNYTFDISDDDVGRYMRSLTNDLQKSQLIDQQAHKRAEDIYGRLQQGEKWEDVATECSDDKLVAGKERFAKEWIWVGADALGNKELARMLATLSVGEVTRPVELPEGLMVFKILARQNKMSKLARIKIQLSKPVRLPKNFDEAKRSFQAILIESARESKLKQLRQNAKIEYPLGMRFTYKIWK